MACFAVPASPGMWAKFLRSFREFSVANVLGYWSPTNGDRGWSMSSVLLAQLLLLVLLLFTCCRRVDAACHRACAGNCSGPGAKSCDECAAGYHRQEDNGEESECLGVCSSPSYHWCAFNRQG